MTVRLSFDSQGAEKIDSIVRYLEANRITFKLARVKPRVKVILDRDGVSSRIGEANIHLDVNDAVDAYLEQALR